MDTKNLALEEFLILKKFKKLLSYIHHENPFISATTNFKNEIKPLFSKYFSNTDITHEDFSKFSEQIQFQLLIIQVFHEEGNKVIYNGARPEILDYLFNCDAKKLNISNLINRDSFKEIWCRFVMLGMGSRFMKISKRGHIDSLDWGDLYAHDFVDKRKFNTYLPKLYSAGYKNFEIKLDQYSFMRWKQIGFVKTLAKCNLDWLINGPPSFHKNKELLIQLLKEFPDYYFLMKNRKLKKDTDITKTVINAKPELLEKIPRQYIGEINPFILSQAIEKNPENINKYIGECRGVLCITGKLKSFKTKKEATQAIELQGFAVSKNLTLECDYLVSEGDVVTTKLNKVLEDKKAKHSYWGNPYRDIEIIKNLDRFLKKSALRDKLIP